MLHNDIGRLPVVDRKDPPQHVVGYLGRPEIMAARLHRLDQEHVARTRLGEALPVTMPSLRLRRHPERPSGREGSGVASE